MIWRVLIDRKTVRFSKWFLYCIYSINLLTRLLLSLLDRLLPSSIVMLVDTNQNVVWQQVVACVCCLSQTILAVAIWRNFSVTVRNVRLKSRVGRSDFKCDESILNVTNRFKCDESMWRIDSSHWKIANVTDRLANVTDRLAMWRIVRFATLDF